MIIKSIYVSVFVFLGTTVIFACDTTVSKINKIFGEVNIRLEANEKMELSSILLKECRSANIRCVFKAERREDNDIESENKNVPKEIIFDSVEFTLFELLKKAKELGVGFSLESNKEFIEITFTKALNVQVVVKEN